MSTIDDLTTTPRLGVVRLDTNAKLPTKAHYGDLGYDLYALNTTFLQPKTVTLVDTGIACNFPPGFGALLRDRSSMATKVKIFVVAGVIDQGYTGQVKIAFYNPHDAEIVLQAGEKIAQMILTPVITMPINEVTELQTSARGAGGFGSTGTV